MFRFITFLELLHDLGGELTLRASLWLLLELSGCGLYPSIEPLGQVSEIHRFIGFDTFGSEH